MDTKWKKWSDMLKRIRKLTMYVDILMLFLLVAVFYTCNWLDHVFNMEFLVIFVFFLTVDMYLFCLIVKRWRQHKFKKENWICYLLAKGFLDRITGVAYYEEGVVLCNKKRFRFTGTAVVVLLLISYWFFLQQPINWEFRIEMCLFAGVILLFIYRYGTKKILKEYEKLLLQFEEISRGNYWNTSILEENSVFYRESGKMSQFGNQLQENLEKQLQAERMKVDLITNVSHDLKTPLTSIISYIDLLSKEELNPVSQEYVSILINKSERLKNMIADVFELAKVTSGNVKIEKELVDIRKLLVQTLADMEDEIEKAPVKVVQKISEQAARMESDGKKLYRVLQNIIGNALRYAMPDTRVYISLQTEKDRTLIEVKNVSCYEMNFTAEEMTGRFVRGDKARSTEGSGLGLAIAKEFAEVCGGTLKVEVDGDVFCVKMAFPVLENKL